MKLNSEGLTQLSFHIKEYVLAIDISDIEYSVTHPTDTALAARITQNLKYDSQLRSNLNQRISQGFISTADRRIGIINDPQEVMDSLDFENFSFENMEVAFRHMMDKLEF